MGEDFVCGVFPSFLRSVILDGVWNFRETETGDFDGVGIWDCSRKTGFFTAAIVYDGGVF